MLAILISFFFQFREPTIKKSLHIDSASKTINQDYEEILESIYPDDVPSMSIQELKELNRNGVHLLDARTKKEFEVSHLKYAREVGYFWFDMRSIYDISKKSTVVVYCAVGNRSSKIAEKLIKAGYKNVYMLYGGIFEWVNEGNPVYTHSNIQTPQVHGYTKKWSKWLEKGNRVL